MRKFYCFGCKELIRAATAGSFMHGHPCVTGHNTRWIRVEYLVRKHEQRVMEARL